jgi:hypothetical protein
MILTITVIVLAFILGFYGSKLDNTWGPGFHVPYFLIVLLFGFVVIFFINAYVFDGDPVIIEDGEYNLVPIEIGEREGYVIQYYNESGTVGLLVGIEKNGIIVPLSIPYSYNVEIVEDGKCIMKSKNVTKGGNVFLNFTTARYADELSIHIPPQSLIMKFGVQTSELNIESD